MAEKISSLGKPYPPGWIPPPQLQNEEDRVRALENYGILDSEQEAVFDQITDFASKICDCPISLVSLVDGKRQWFKSKQGLDADETPKDMAFCAHALSKPTELFEVRDSRTDPRFKANPLAEGDPHVIFYAGVVLVNEDNLPFGTLCVIDSRPRNLTPIQREALTVLGKMVMNQMELRKANNMLMGELKGIMGKRLGSVEKSVSTSQCANCGGAQEKITALKAEVSELKDKLAKYES